MVMIPQLSKARRFRLVLRAVFLSTGIVAAFISSVLLEEGRYWWAALPGIVVVLASFAEFILADLVTESLYPAHTRAVLERLEDDLRSIHDQIRSCIESSIDSLHACDHSQVSGTFHLKVELYSFFEAESEEALVQVVDYSGNLGGRKWRFTPATKGLVGRCLRTGEPESVNFASEQEYRELMVRDFGFTPAEVEQHTRSARSYWAQPVKMRGQLIGVLFFFSTEVQVFPQAIEAFRLEAAASEIAAFLAGAGVLD